MKREVLIFLLCSLLTLGTFFAKAQERDVEALPPEPSEEEIPSFEVEEGEKVLPVEPSKEEVPPSEVEVKPVEPAKAPPEEPVAGEPMKEVEERLPRKRVLPEEAVPEGKELVLKAYEVISGDCLWDIAYRFYRDPFLWREIWKYNEYIKDPHWIFPGDDLVVPTYQQKEVAKAGVREPEVRLEEPTIEGEYEKDVFIAPPDFEFDGCIAAVKEKKLMPAQGDIVFIDLGTSQNVKPKTRYTIYREEEEVIHPRTGRVLGIMIEKIGVLEVTTDIEEDSSTAVIIDSRKPVEIGDSIKLQVKLRKEEP